MKEHKILFTGTMGAGKTTAISTISEIPPVRTEVRNLDSSAAKDTTTVGLDYGEITLDNGQERFDFMWRILAKGALGVIILIDNSRPDPLADLDMYAEAFAALIAETGCVVGVGRMESHATPGIDDFVQRLSARGIMAPVVSTDVRQSENVLQLLDLLLLQLEIF
jgi:signal recognition particle receptor subunit beta